MKAEHLRTGAAGEQAVLNHLKRKGYVLRETNYRKKWGEIDLIMEKERVVHFIEVKTVSCGTGYGGQGMDTWLPEENVSVHKLKKLGRTIETWLSEHEYTAAWQLDVASVWIDTKNKRGRIKIIENVVEEF